MHLLHEIRKFYWNLHTQCESKGTVMTNWREKLQRFGKFCRGLANFAEVRPIFSEVWQILQRFGQLRMQNLNLRPNYPTQSLGKITS